MSRAPIISGHQVVPERPVVIGITNRKIIVIPCIVNISS